MQIARTECGVREAFCIDPYSFLKEKVEKEGLFDYEIASLLDVNSAWIGKLRKALGLNNSKKFLRRFERKYGKGAVRRFKEIIEKRENGLSDVARYFGFTREYARHAYKKIYGRPYTLHYQKKLTERKRYREHQRLVKSKRMKSLVDIQEKLASCGAKTQIVKRGRSYVMEVNGKKVAVKVSKKPIKVNGKLYYHFTNVGCKMSDSDIFVCICASKNKRFHFVIPNDAMPKSTLSIKDPDDSGPGKYLKYLEAWNLIAATC
ncbi:MAG: hypothetical protein DRH12_03930 [Deltaproteobacteria bacterium]|nr:MAG: hypothetical protein DRH12_03930 [Deltaproteobacteria bacterium]